MKLPPIKKNHIVFILSLLLSLLGGNAAPNFLLDEEPTPLPSCPPPSSSTDGGVEPAVGTLPLVK